MFFLKTRLLVLLSLLALSSCTAYVTGAAASDDANKKSEALLRAVGSHWDVATFDRLVVPGFYTSIKHKDVQKLFSIFARKLGPIRTLKLQSSAQRATVGTSGQSIEAQFTYTATFAKGAGQILLVTLDQGKGFGIENLHVNSDALIE